MRKIKSFGGCSFRKEHEGDGSHGSCEMEDGSLVEVLFYGSLVEVFVEVEASTNPGKKEEIKPQKANAKRGSTSGQM